MRWKLVRNNTKNFWRYVWESTWRKGKIAKLMKTWTMVYGRKLKHPTTLAQLLPLLLQVAYCHPIWAKYLSTGVQPVPFLSQSPVAIRNLVSLWSLRSMQVSIVIQLYHMNLVLQLSANFIAEDSRRPFSDPKNSMAHHLIFSCMSLSFLHSCPTLFSSLSFAG